MKITPLQTFNMNFTSGQYHSNNNVKIHIADDISGAKTRSAIRTHIYPQLLYEEDSYDEIPDYAVSIEDVYIPNMENIGAGSYKGASLFRNPEYINLLKQSNITMVVDLAGFDKLKNACREHDMEYYRYYVPLNYWTNPIFIENQTLFDKYEKELYNQSLTKNEFLCKMKDYKEKIRAERNDFMDEFIKFTHKMNQGSLYIGCDLGEFRTPNVLALNAYFNPNWTGHKSEPTTPFIKECMQNMYRNLTENDKQRLGFTKEYDEHLKEKLGIKKDGE